MGSCKVLRSAIFCSNSDTNYWKYETSHAYTFWFRGGMFVWGLSYGQNVK